MRHHTKDNFLVHCSNPLKIIVILLMLTKKFCRKFPGVSSKALRIHGILIKVGISLIETINSTELLKDICEDTLFNGSTVIDMIAHFDLVELLENPYMDNLISQYWTGPYENYFFLRPSFSYRATMYGVRHMTKKGNTVEQDQ